MHCRICDSLLTDFEATRRNAHTGQFLDICNVCFAESGLKDIMPTRDRKDLIREFDMDDIDKVSEIDYSFNIPLDEED